MKRPFKKTINCDILQLFTIRNEQKPGTRHSSEGIGQKRASETAICEPSGGLGRGKEWRTLRLPIFYSTGEPGPTLRKYVVGNFKVE